MRGAAGRLAERESCKPGGRNSQGGLLLVAARFMGPRPAAAPLRPYTQPLATGKRRQYDDPHKSPAAPGSKAMQLTEWRRWVRRVMNRAAARGRRGGGHLRPRLEGLEPRLAPAVSVSDAVLTEG